MLRGSAEHDTLIGGVGNNELANEADADRFVFGSGKTFKASDFGVDAIADFNNFGSDKIVLSNQ